MTKRTYAQFCSVAAALDALGERWTILVARDLLPGPQRFTDLMARQPSISTDMLSRRLRDLTEMGFVEQVALPAPARGSMYQLTDSGQRLRPLIGELAKIGAPLLPDPAFTSHHLSPAWAMATIAEHFARPAPTSGGLQIVCDEEPHALAVQPDGSVRAVYQPIAQPDVSLRGAKYPLLGVLVGRLPLADHLSELDIVGDPADVAEWLQAIHSAVAFLGPRTEPAEESTPAS